MCVFRPFALIILLIKQRYQVAKTLVEFRPRELIKIVADNERRRGFSRPVEIDSGDEVLVTDFWITTWKEAELKCAVVWKKMEPLLAALALIFISTYH